MDSSPAAAPRLSTTATTVAASKKKGPSLPPPPPDDWERWLPHETEEDYLMDLLLPYDYEKRLREDLEEYYMACIWKPFLDYEEKEREKEMEKLMQLEVMQFEKDGKLLPPPKLNLMQFLKDGKRLPPPKLKEIPSDDEYISKVESEPEVLPPKPPSDSNSVEKVEDLLDLKIGHPNFEKGYTLKEEYV
ncbi:hypothetical protein M6B38_232775 [Iris pallida]|uniref:Uncharacterized protein n=1 Tax=Iris pallida TaxID=29817 RepID=A0AAX6DRL7_IRIPA|nr:hypothetical protein M6B38_232775 [Iris pallida]